MTDPRAQAIHACTVVAHNRALLAADETDVVIDPEKVVDAEAARLAWAAYGAADPVQVATIEDSGDRWRRAAELLRSGWVPGEDVPTGGER